MKENRNSEHTHADAMREDGGYEHRDLKPAGERPDPARRDQPTDERNERAAVMSFRAADFAGQKPTPPGQPTATATAPTDQPTGERSTSATRELPIGNGDHLVVFGNGDASVMNERNGGQFDKVPKIGIEDAAAAVFSAKNDWPAHLRENVLVHLSRMKWGTGTR